MAFKIAASNEHRQDPLIYTGHCGGVEPSPLFIPFHQRGREHQIAHTDGGAMAFEKVPI